MAKINKETSLWIYTKMNEIRDFEEAAWTLFTENKLRGSVHLYTGEESVAAAICAQLSDEDYMRPHTAATATASQRARTWAERWRS